MAKRYLSARKRDKSSPSLVFAILGIALGVLALTVVLAVMNGFQIGFIESILEISSFHLRGEAINGSANSDPAFAEALRLQSGVKTVLPYLELQALAIGERLGQQAVLLRGLPAEAGQFDSSFAERLGLDPKRLKFHEAEIIVGSELAKLLGLGVGDELSLMVLSGAALAGTTQADNLFKITAIFNSGYYEFDLSWVFISLDEANRLAAGKGSVVYGLKLNQRWDDVVVLAALKSAFPTLTFESWRDYNRSFFGALRTEKVMMFMLVGLIFLIVAVNIFQAQRRFVLERQEEIGLLQAIGAHRLAIRMIFTLDGLIIGLSGALGGLIPGLLISTNITSFFTGIESVVNAIIGLINLAGSLFGLIDSPDSFSFFSPTVFYIKEITTILIPGEIAIIFGFGCLSAAVAAWFASGKVSRIQPAEVLRDE